MLKEQVFSINNFKTPKVYEGNDAIYLLLVRLLLLEPGKDVNRPEMGIGIVSRWRFADVENIPILNDEIQNQIAAYMPDAISAQVSVYAEEKVLKIDITVGDTMYKFSADQDNGLLSLNDL